jgi:copper(I)-binding protein
MNRELMARFGGAPELLCVPHRELQVDMKHLFRRLALGLLLASFCAGHVAAQQVKAGELVIENAWSRAAPVGADVGAGYLVIKNSGTAADRLVGGTTDAACALEFHTMTVKDGMMTMEQIADGLLIEPGKSIAFTPGGNHIMFVGLHAPLKQGEKLQATLQFEKASRVEVTFRVQSVGSPGPTAHHGSHTM